MDVEIDKRQDVEAEMARDKQLVETALAGFFVVWRYRISRRHADRCPSGALRAQRGRGGIVFAKRKPRGAMRIDERLAWIALCVIRFAIQKIVPAARQVTADRSTASPRR